MNKNKIVDFYDPIDLYKRILLGEIKKFPDGYWRSENKDVALTKIIKWLLEEHLKFDREQIAQNVSVEFFKKYKLTSPLDMFYNKSAYALLNSAYPNEFKEWELKNVYVSNGFWDGSDERVIEAIKWLVEDKLKMTGDKIFDITLKDFMDNGLGTLIRKKFNCSPCRAIDKAYPKKYNLWQFKSTPNKFWKGEQGKKNAIKATRWLIEDKLDLSFKQVYDITFADFTSNDLGGMICSVYKNNVFKAIDAAYPNCFNAWEFFKSPKGYWDGEDATEKGIKATKWLVETKLKIFNDRDITRCINKYSFRTNGLAIMLKKVFNDDYTNAIMSAYPDRFKKEDFKYKKSITY